MELGVYLISSYDKINSVNVSINNISAVDICPYQNFICDKNSWMIF
jgi:hypothetical protein